MMARFIEGESRTQSTLFPERLEDYVSEDNPVKVVEAFIDALDLERLGFHGMNPKATGRPAYHPSTMLKIFLYGYLNRIQSSRRLLRAIELLAAGESVTSIALELGYDNTSAFIAMFRRCLGTTSTRYFNPEN
jgi:AraC-like DNA-binding protein